MSAYPYSNFPGPTVEPQPDGEEEQGSDGGRRGHSTARLPIGAHAQDFEIVHFAEAVTSEAQADAQRLFVWLRVAGEFAPVAAVEFEHPEDRDLDDRRHWGVWEARYVENWGIERGQGVATLLYTHAAAFGYHIAKSAVSTGAEGLWERLHPGFDDDVELVYSHCDRSATDLAHLIARFGPNPAGPLINPRTLDRRTWSLGAYGRAPASDRE